MFNAGTFTINGGNITGNEAGAGDNDIFLSNIFSSARRMEFNDNR